MQTIDADNRSRSSLVIGQAHFKIWGKTGEKPCVDIGKTGKVFYPVLEGIRPLLNQPSYLPTHVDLMIHLDLLRRLIS